MSEEDKAAYAAVKKALDDSNGRAYAGEHSDSVAVTVYGATVYVSWCVCQYVSYWLEKAKDRADIQELRRVARERLDD